MRLQSILSFLASMLLTSVSVLSAIDSPANQVQTDPITFNKDVAPILHKHCSDCHSPDNVAPMSLLTYQEARPWARAIKEKVVTREMPPWGADPRYGRFKNDRGLSRKEIETIAAWVDGGAKGGTPDDRPRTQEPASREMWRIGTPDVVLTANHENVIEPDSPDRFIYLSLATNFKEDRWIQAAEIRPGRKSYVHHALAFVQTPEAAARLQKMRGQNQLNKHEYFYLDGTLSRVKMDAPVINDGCSNAALSGGQALGENDWIGLFLPAGFFSLAGYVPGMGPDIWPEGTAMRLPAGAVVVFQIHYSTLGKTLKSLAKDKIDLGLIFGSQPPKRSIHTLFVSNRLFKIPARAENHQVTACHTFEQDVDLIAYAPHMHLRGKDMKYEAVYPDGRRETLISVPKYNFNWQTWYYLKKPLPVPKGTRLVATSHFDNSPKNKYNPDPAKDVRWGDSSSEDEMLGAWVAISIPNR